MYCIAVISFCSFPTDKVRRDRWIVRVKRADEATGKLWEPGPRSVLCSEHFNQSYFYCQWGRKLIKADAEPTIFTFKQPVKQRKPPVCRTLPTPTCSASTSETDNVAMEIEIEHDSITNVSPCDKGKPVLLEHSYAVKSPTKLARQNDTLLQRLRARYRELRNARRREGRLRGKVSDLLKRMKSMQLLTSQAEDLLETYKDIPLNLLSGKSGNQYSQEQKQFAVTLNFYSPAAYKFVRRRFKLLPCPRTIRNWLSSVNGNPGLTEQAFATIARKNSSTDIDASHYKICALHIDEMEIKKQLEIERSTGKVIGFTDLGSGMTSSQVI
jgi:Transposase protein/THAP domain